MNTSLERTWRGRVAIRLRGGLAAWALLTASALPGAELPASARPASPAEPRVIRRLDELLALSAEDRKARPRVEVRAVATCHDTGFNLFFVHDGAAGAYVHLPDVSTEYAPGQNLEIKGVARQGQFAPFIAEPQVRVVGPGSMPAAIAAAGADLLSGRLDAQWVEIRGVVRAARVSQARLQLTVVSGMTRFKAWVRLSQTNQVPDFANREVNLRGVVAAQLNAAKQVEGSQLFLNSLADVRTLDSPSDSAAAAGPVPVRDLQGYRLRREGGRRLQVRGTVAARWSSGGFLLVDPTGSVEVQSVDGARVAPDEVVEVTGFLTPRPCTPRLEDATVQRVGFAERTRPTLVADGNLWKPALQHQKVRVEADLVTRTVVGADLLVLVLQRGERFFRAALSSSNAPSELLWLEPGQRLDLTGVCHFNMEAPGLGGLESVCPWCDGACQIQSGKKPGQLQATLWLGEAADLRVSSKALPRWLGPGLAVGTLVLLLATAALLSRRRRLEVERLLAEQMSLQSELREQDRKLRRSLEERERIGHDLHDDIIQSIYAVGLGLEDTRRHLRKDVDKAESRLTAGVESLNGIIQRVRTFIGGLEPKVLNGAEFKTALKSLALTAGESHAQFHIQVDSTVANGLTSDLATQLLMIAKEAISNSLRHAKASRIMVALTPTGRGFTLEVADDGVGFDRRSSEGQGQGLRNMAARSAALGAELHISSAPGTGCRVVVSVSEDRHDDRG